MEIVESNTQVVSNPYQGNNQMQVVELTQTSEDIAKYCLNCGVKLERVGKFCAYCGTNLE